MTPSNLRLSNKSPFLLAGPLINLEVCNFLPSQTNNSICSQYQILYFRPEIYLCTELMRQSNISHARNGRQLKTYKNHHAFCSSLMSALVFRRNSQHFVDAQNCHMLKLFPEFKQNCSQQLSDLFKRNLFHF